MRYIPHTPADKEAMLKKIGVESVDDLFSQIPAEARFNKKLDLPQPLGEFELQEHMSALADKNMTGLIPLTGAGIYSHFIPSAVDQLLLRSEFYTAYTPYQPEISQGTLQAIFEFQSVICRIFNMETSNASMYDGATAMVEAALMARRVAKRDRIIVSAGVHPEYIETLKTYINALDGSVDAIKIVPLNPVTGVTDIDILSTAVTAETACVITGFPNFFGVVEPLDKIVNICRDAGVKSVTSTLDPFAFGLINPPGSFGVDIATGEGQAIAVAPSYGGPGLGLFAIRDDKKLLRQMPGRLVGKTKDNRDQDGFVLTLATREQHIRREKATSNICTNHGLCALSCVINTSLLGKDGFVHVAKKCLSLAQYLKKGIAKLDKFEITHSGATFNEFAVTCKTAPAKQVLIHLEKAGFAGGVDLGQLGFDSNLMLVAVTEILSKAKLDSYLAALSQF